MSKECLMSFAIAQFEAGVGGRKDGTWGWLKTKVQLQKESRCRNKQQQWIVFSGLMIVDMGVLVMDMSGREAHVFCAVLCSIQSLGRWRGSMTGSIKKSETRWKKKDK